MSTFNDRLRAAFPAHFGEIRALLDAPETAENYKQAETFVRSCYHRPKQAEIVMYALAEIIGGYGVEGVSDPNDMRNGMDYVNMGDTYATTITHYWRAYRVESYGDALDRLGW